MNPKELGTVISHPIDALRVMRWQALVALDHASPPSNTTIEDFAALPLAKAMEKVWQREKEQRLLEKEQHLLEMERVWQEERERQLLEKGYSKADSSRLMKGELPQGYPRDPRM